MRTSLLRQNQRFLQTCEAFTRRNIAPSPQRASQACFSTCQTCSRPAPRPREQSQPPTRRFQTSSVRSRPAVGGDSIKSKPLPQTHYEFFPKTLSKGPPPNGPFPIDLQELRREFLQLQAVAHPDRQPTHLKTRGEATSARINEAYKTLQNPLSRAQYLLSLRGVDVAEDETAKVEDPELLMEVLETREEIEGAQEEEELEGLKKVNDSRILVSEGVLDAAFKEDDIRTAKEEAVKLRYWVNIRESLEGWEKGKPVVLVH